MLYELHVGTFTQEGTYAAAGRHLKDLKDLGITALQFMPLAAFPGVVGGYLAGRAQFLLATLLGLPERVQL